MNIEFKIILDEHKKLTELSVYDVYEAYKGKPLLSGWAKLSTAYTEYIVNHISNVYRAYERRKEAIREFVTAGYMSVGGSYVDTADEFVDDILYNHILVHDFSKFSSKEYVGYKNYYYGDPDKKNSPNVYGQYMKAWNNHIHDNMHHPEHWIIPGENGNNTLTPMPVAYIFEMLLDWDSFGDDGGNGGAYEFYHDVDIKEGLFDKMTRDRVELILDKVFKPNYLKEHEATFHVGDTVKHFKTEKCSEEDLANGAYTYKIISLDAKSSETKERQVIYQALYTDAKWGIKYGDMFVRPYSMFMSKVDKDRYSDIEQEFRFEVVK